MIIFQIWLIFHFTFFVHIPDNPQIKIVALLQSVVRRPKRKRKLPFYAVLELVDNSEFTILLSYTSWDDMCRKFVACGVYLL